MKAKKAPSLIKRKESAVPSEYKSLAKVPPVPDPERDLAANSYIAKLKPEKLSELKWPKVYGILRGAEIEPGKEILDMEDLAYAYIGLISLGHSEKTAIACLHVGQCTTMEFNALNSYIERRQHFKNLKDAAIQQISAKYLDALDNMIFDDRADINQVKAKAPILQWMLQRRNPNEFGNKTQRIVTGADGGPVQTETKTNVVFHLPTNNRIPSTMKSVIDAELIDDGQPIALLNEQNRATPKTNKGKKYKKKARTPREKIKEKLGIADDELEGMGDNPDIVNNELKKKIKKM
jgi:hypothetical protein